MSVITEAMPAVRSLAIGFLIDVGSASESESECGLAHLTEHLLFQGTSNRSASAIAQLMDLAGGQIGGFTTRDYTCFQALVLDEHATYALDLFGDLLLNSTFPELALAREKEAILHEIHATRDAPDRRVHDLVKAHAWASHPLGRPVYGNLESLSGLSREDVIYFFHKRYTPDAMVVAASGRVNHEDFVAQVRDAFWRLMGQKWAVTLEPPALEKKFIFEEAPVAQAYFALALPAPPYAHEDRYALYVLANLLGGGFSSRLYRRLREERGLVYQVSAEYHAYRSSGMLVIEGSTAPELLTEVVGLIYAEITQLAHGTNSIDDEEAWKAILHLRRQHLLEAESTHTRMSRLLTQELYFGKQIPSAEILSAIEGMTAQHLEQKARHWLASGLDQATLTVVGPRTDSLASSAKLQDSLEKSWCRSP